MSNNKEELSPKYKYLLHQYLNQLPHAHYKIISKQLPKKLDVSLETFRKWKYIRLNSKATIPADKLAVIAKFFDLNVEDLFNYPIPVLKIEDLLDEAQRDKTKTYEKSSKNNTQIGG